MRVGRRGGTSGPPQERMTRATFGGAAPHMATRRRRKQATSGRREPMPGCGKTDCNHGRRDAGVRPDVRALAVPTTIILLCGRPACFPPDAFFNRTTTHAAYRRPNNLHQTCFSPMPLLLSLTRLLVFARPEGSRHRNDLIHHANRPLRPTPPRRSPAAQLLQRGVACRGQHCRFYYGGASPRGTVPAQQLNGAAQPLTWAT
jgi:hypothetical protein